MKQKISLTESQLKAIIKDSIRKSLSEGALGQKGVEMNQDWNDLRIRYDNSSDTYYRPIGKYDNGYWSEYIKPDEELEMYQSMGNPSQYATKGEFQKYARNRSGYGSHKTPLRHEDGNLSIAAQSEPTTVRDIYGDDDDSEINVRYRDSDGNNKITTTASYARNPSKFRGNEDMHDLESKRIAQANADAEAEGRYMRDLAGLEESIKRMVKKMIIKRK